MATIRSAARSLSILGRTSPLHKAAITPRKAVSRMSSNDTGHSRRVPLAAPLTISGPHDAKIPRLVYGTAWKKGRTDDLVYKAIKAGFRGIDTAAQPRHYQEKLVGDGIRRAIKEGIVKREDLYIQTKFTPPSGQDPNNMPYDPSLPIAVQVQVSVQSSLQNLKTSDNPSENYLDAVLLHSPLPTIHQTISAWTELTKFVSSGHIHHLGICNTPLSVLQYLYETTAEKPVLVQNRFYPSTQWEVPLRDFCKRNGIVFQSFWTLTGNPELVRSPLVGQFALKAGVSREVGFYALVLGLGDISVLDGTTSEVHMREDLEGIETVGRYVQGEGKEDSERTMMEFRRFIGQI